MDTDNMTGSALEAAVMDVKFNNEAAPCDRVTCQLQVAHQTCGEQPIAVQVVFTMPCANDEQPYQRRIAVGPTPVPLDTHWVKEPGYIVLENRTRHTGTTNPTPAEAARLAKHLILVYIEGTPVFSIPPGGVFMGYVEHLERLSICSNDGPGTVNITAMPR